MFETDKDPAEIGQGTEQQTEQAQNTDPLSIYRANALDLLQAAKITPGRHIEPLRPLLRYIDGQSGRAADLLCRGTLTMITGQKGCRKSTLVRALCAVLLNGKLQGSESPDTLTARAGGLRLAVIDTEQHESRVQNSYNWLQTIYRQPQPFATRCDYYSGRGMDADTLHDLCVTICEQTRPDVIFLDVISHFVDDINDQKAAKYMVDFLNQICERYGVAIVGIIHQNPSPQATAADKMAGALGTKLLQAAECVLHVARVPEGLQKVDANGNTEGFLFGRGSVITFAEYRERWPDIMQILLQNENERGAYELSLQPVTIKNEQPQPGKPKILRAFIQPARMVTEIAQRIASAEAAALSPEIPAEPQTIAPTFEEYNAVLQQADTLTDPAGDDEQAQDDLPF